MVNTTNGGNPRVWFDEGNGLSKKPRHAFLYKRIKTGLALVLGLFVWEGVWAGISLPVGYERLEAVESTGSQYINSDYTPRAATPFVVELEGCWTSDAFSNYMLFGVCNTDKNRYDFGRTGKGHSSHANAWNLGPAFSANGSADMADHHFMVNFATGVMTVDGEEVVTWSVPSGRTDAAQPFYLFARRTNSNAVNCQSPFRLRACRFLQGGVLVRDFVPTKRTTDGKVGLFDLVESRFYEPNEALIGLAYVPNLRLNYLESNGTQYINSECTPRAATAFSVELEGRWMSDSFENYMLFGVCNGDADRYDFGRTGQKHSSHRNSWNLASQFSLNDSADMVDHRFVANFATGAMAVDGETVLTWSVPKTRTDAKQPFYLFARRTNSNAVNCKSPFRLRSCKLIQGDEVQRDFVPGMNPTNGVVGLVDLANGGKFYPKNGGDDFKWGYAYLPKETGESISIYVGTLTDEDMVLPRDFEKVGFHSVSAAAVTRFPAALTLAGGELSFVDEAARVHEVAGALTLRGGTTLAIDITTSACDRFVAGSLVFDASVTAIDPVYVNVSDVAGQGTLAEDAVLPFLSVAGQVLTEADAAKFRVKGVRAEVAAVEGALVLRAVPASAAAWTGEAGDGKWSTAGNWLDDALPRNGGVVLFNAAAGGAATMDIPGLSVASVKFGADAGSFAQGGAQMLTVESALTNDSQMVQTFLMPMEFGYPGVSFSFSTTGDLVLTGGVKKAVSPVWVKSGAGILHVNDETLAQATNVTVEAGVLRLERTGRVMGASVGGVLTIHEGAQLDLHVNNNGNVLASNEATHGKTVYVAGSGPAGSKGAIDNSSAQSGWGCNFGKLVLTADTTVGGGWMAIRDLTGSVLAGSALEGAYTLTVRNEDLFLLHGCKIALDRLDVRGNISFESSISGSITNGVHCYSNSMLQFCNASVPETISVTVEESGTMLKCAGGNGTMAGTVALLPDVETTFNCQTNLTLNGAVTNNGKVTQTGTGKLMLAGVLSGNGSFSGESVCFSGAASRWEIEVDDAGAVSMVDFSGVTAPQLFVGLKALDVRVTGTSAAVQTIDLGPAGALTEQQASDIALAVVNGQGVVVPNCHLDVTDGKLVLTLRDASLVRTAVWTGAGNDPTDFADPANWTCRNDQGQDIERGVPGEHTIIEITSGSMFDCPAEKPLVYLNVRFASGASLGKDCDWSGLDFARILEGGVLDLAGHSLTVAVQADLAAAFTVTDSTEQGGVLRVVVPGNTTVVNTQMALTGSLRFAKSGEGVLSMAKLGQTYTGGTEVEGGTLTLPVSGSDKDTYSAYRQPFGTAGSSITVDAGATFDTKGNYDFYLHPILLNGGTLANTGCDMGKMVSNGWRSIGNVTLLADSFFNAAYRPRFSEGVIDLGGHTLTVTLSATYFHLDGDTGRYCNVSNGTLVVNATAGGLFNPMGKSFFVRDMRTVDLVLNAPLSINNDIWVHNLTVGSTVNKAYNNGKTCIYGVYTPVSNYMYNFVMQDGATLNLRDKTTAWSANPDPALTVCKTLSFVENARINIDLTGRLVRNGDCIVSWDTAKVPANVGTVSFKPIGSLGSFYQKEDGVYIRKGLVLIFK